MGGLATALMGTLLSFLSSITYNIAASKFILALHPNKKSHKHAKKINKSKIFCGNVSFNPNELPTNFTMLEILDNIFWMKGITCCFKNNKKYMKNADLFKKHFRIF